MKNKVVVHYSNGNIDKGETGDFFPNKPHFHLQPLGSNETKQINMQTLKAVYFVETFEGNSNADKEDIKLERAGFGRKLRVQFEDGEVQYGYTQGYSPDRPGFFVSPCDPSSNNIRIFVVTGSTTSIKFV
ncbi:DUF6982 domain-containing protein [Geopsychrobacter electrodiphilus]|uniref:DUF6982 domain-containing protein n=1 Tax=Geopsychrobacter electrodiphilus TaxID=225196 RepID=UPI000381856A|nr:hypothetical protein [Geopsychrobacter electrodiphilus]